MKSSDFEVIGGGVDLKSCADCARACSWEGLHTQDPRISRAELTSTSRVAPIARMHGEGKDCKTQEVGGAGGAIPGVCRGDIWMKPSHVGAISE